MNNSGFQPSWAVLALAAALLPPGLAFAEEGGSGHYFPGSMSE
jgi:hypothetical protein